MCGEGGGGRGGEGSGEGVSETFSACSTPGAMQQNALLKCCIPLCFFFLQNKALQNNEYRSTCLNHVTKM